MKEKFKTCLTAKRLLLLAAVLLAVISIPLLARQPDAHCYRALRIRSQGDEVVESAIYMDGEKLATVEGDLSMFHSMDGNRALVIVWKEKALYMLENGELNPITSQWDGAVISASGRGVVYLDEDRSLHLYRRGKTQDLGRCDVLLRDCAVSPDGNTVGFVRDNTACCYSGGRLHKIGENLKWLAAADGGKYLYFYDTETRKIYVQRGWSERTRMELPAVPVYYNADLSQAILRSLPGEDGWDSYILRDGKNLTYLSNIGDPKISQWTAQVWTGRGMPQNAAIVNVDSFRGLDLALMDHMYSTQYHPKAASALCRIGENYSLTVLHRFVGNASPSPDGGTCYTIDSKKNLWRVGPDGTSETLGCWPADDMTATNYGVYYWRQMGLDEYYYVDESGEKVLLDLEGLSEVYPGPGETALLLCTRTVTKDGFTTHSGALYADRKGESRLVLRVENARKLHSSQSREEVILSWLNDDGTWETHTFPNSQFDALWEGTE